MQVSFFPTPRRPAAPAPNRTWADPTSAVERVRMTPAPSAKANAPVAVSKSTLPNAALKFTPDAPLGDSLNGANAALDETIVVAS